MTIAEEIAQEAWDATKDTGLTGIQRYQAMLQTVADENDDLQAEVIAACRRMTE